MENRENRRFDLNKVNMISIKINSENSELIDLSKDGIQVLLTDRPQKQKVAINFKVNERTFDLKGHIHWIRNSNIKVDKYQVGISIIDPPEGYLQEIDKLLTVY